MPRKPKSRKKNTKSRLSPNTKKSKESTRTSSLSRPKKNLHERLANELYSRSLEPKISKSLQEAVVEGISMWPVLRPGYRVLFRKVDPEALLPGDMIVIQRKQQLLVHRMLGRVGPLFLEAGDNTFSASLVRPQDLRGKVEKILDWKGAPLPVPAFEGSLRFRFFAFMAHSFMYAHGMKDRMVGNRRSALLWRASEVYRASLSTFGLQVPTIFPK